MGWLLARRRLAILLTGAVSAVTVPLIAAVSGAATPNEHTFTREITRTFDNGDGSVFTADKRTITVKIDKTANLRGRERVHITWSGAHPTGGRAVNPYGEQGLKQEYPVLILQCRGRDGSGLSPNTCWTSSREERSPVSVSDASTALWRLDAAATPADRDVRSGVTPFPDKATCPAVTDDDATHLTPFVAANGHRFLACDADTMPPEAAVGSSFPPAEISAFTNPSGKGEVYFEVRSDVENESLGCNDKVACSIVVIPIEGLSCVPKAGSIDPAGRACRKTGVYDPTKGESYESGRGYDLAVSPRFWWSASNWKNRITIPITFGPPPNVCDLLDPRAPVGFYGSELMSQANLQWAPAYCLDKKRFKFQGNKMPDDAAFNLLDTGQAAGAFLSGKRDSGNSNTIGYAPTAVTGFAVGYVVDKPNNSGEVTNLRLNARLLAKLLTTSYVGSQAGKGHPGMANNPLGINLDPEFQALNPNLPEGYLGSEAPAALMSLSVSSDVMGSLTGYLDRDPEARAFLDGKADPWGMVVNPSYLSKGKPSLPLSDWPLNDDWLLPSNDPCQKANTTPYLSQVAAPVSSLRTISEAVLDGWPLVQTKTDSTPDASSPSGYLCKYGRIDRQDVGHRFLLGLVDLGDAARLGLRTASLQTNAANPSEKFSASGRTFAAPTLGGLAAALGAYTPTDKTSPFTFNAKKLKASAYPGTMIVYTASRLSGMAKDQAKDVAMFIRTATTEGQILGSGNGKLPDGYLPLVKSGETAALWNQAQAVATLVEAQTAPGPAPSKTPKSEKSSSPNEKATKTPSDSATAAAGTGGDDAEAGKGKDAQATSFIETDPTAVKTSKIAALLLPSLVLGAAICMLTTPVLRMMIYGSDDS